jgi:hypothetical protein
LGPPGSHPEPRMICFASSGDVALIASTILSFRGRPFLPKAATDQLLSLMGSAVALCERVHREAGPQERAAASGLFGTLGLLRRYYEVRLQQLAVPGAAAAPAAAAPPAAQAAASGSSSAPAGQPAAATCTTCGKTRGADGVKLKPCSGCQGSLHVRYCSVR